MGGGRKGEKRALLPAPSSLLLRHRRRLAGVTLGMRQILNGSCKVTSRERGGGGGGRRRKRQAERQVYQGTHSFLRGPRHHRIELSPFLVLVFVCARPISFVTLRARGRCSSSGRCMGPGCGASCCFWRGSLRDETASIRSGTVSPCTWRMRRETHWE